MTRPTPRPALVRSAMGGFFQLGSSVALLGALLPVWLYYGSFSLATGGDYFLAFNLGLVCAAAGSRGLLGKLGPRGLLVAAAMGAGATLLLLAAILSPVVRIFPMVALGFATGMLTTGVSWLMFDALAAPMAAPLLSLAGLVFGAGAVSFTLLVWATFRTLTAPGLLILTGLLPLVLGLLYLGQRSLAQPALQAVPLRLTWRATGSPAAALLALALFFQSGAEWMVGGWLAIYWIRRFGVRLETALLALAWYWTILTLARLVTPRLPRLTGPFRQITLSAAAALAGCLFLVSAAGWGGAGVGITLLAAGLGGSYPVLIGMIGDRFPAFHPGFFNGLFSLALIGGMLAPWLAGHLADDRIGWIIGAPAVSVVLVYLLLSGVLLEARAARMAKTASSS